MPPGGSESLPKKRSSEISGRLREDRRSEEIQRSDQHGEDQIERGESLSGGTPLEVEYEDSTSHDSEVKSSAEESLGNEFPSLETAEGSEQDANKANCSLQLAHQVQGELAGILSEVVFPGPH